MRMTPISRSKINRGLRGLPLARQCGLGINVGRPIMQRGMGGLGFDWMSAAGSLLSAYGGGAGGDGGAMSPSSANTNVVSVTPTIVTGVSPQISPVFQQQYQPTGSGLTASTSQGQPDAALAALGTGVNSYPVGYPIAQPYAVAAPAASDQLVAGVDNTTLAIAGLGLLWFMTQGSSKSGKSGKKRKGK